MKITARDIARLARVSTRTVSRVLNGDIHVRGETRERVLAAIRETQYRPNTIASLRRSPTQTLGVMVGHSPDVVFSNPFFAEMLRGIGRTTAMQGYKVVLMTYSQDWTKGDLINNRLVDGLILMSLRQDDPMVTHLQELGLPFVQTSRNEMVPYVDVDNVSGGYLAVTHLVQQGHRRIGLINGPLELPSSRERQAGYKKALLEAGISYDQELVVTATFSEDAGYEVAQHFLRMADIPTAIFVTADLMAMGAMRAIHQFGLSVPGDISLIGFDGVSLGQYMNPPLTTINQQGERKGAVAAELLLRMVRGEEPRPLQITLSPELIVRQSTCPPRKMAQLEAIRG
ncbi:MAG: LacI family transcriptional regulator [Firmicutes bacterium]|nr:LacI family transcriptional regulator [Bacillota bacterium]